MTDGQDSGLLAQRIGDSVPRWMLTVVLWALAGILSFYGSTRYNEGRLLATDERIAAITYRVTQLEQNSISRYEHTDLIKRMDTIDTNQRRMDEKLDSVLIRMNGGDGGNGGRRR